MTIDIKKIFEELHQGDSFKKIKTNNTPLSIYCGYHSANLPSLAFMTKDPPLIIESTQYIKVSQWKEDSKVYWSSFDLQLTNASAVFYALCLDLISATHGKVSDTEAMIAVKNRYMVWRKMFKKATSPMTQEEYQGLFGELYFLSEYLIPTIGIESAIKSWSGSDNTSKDFSFEKEWFEIKTISKQATEVRISSLTQLESDNDGHLVVVSVEKMSLEYDDGQSTVEELISSIISKIEDEELKDIFLRKVSAYGYSLDEYLQGFPHYKVHRMAKYIVNTQFPKITSSSLQYNEIVKVSYSLSLNGIKEFEEE